MIAARVSYDIENKTAYIDFHFPVEPIVEQEIVCHAYPVGLHRMSLAIVVVSDIA